jgi:carboxylesterase
LTPSETVHQVLKFFNHLRDDLREVRCPILVVHASMDHRVPLRNADEILSRVQSIQKEKLILNNSYHMITMDNEKEIVNDKVFQFIQRNL